ncbi:UDP-N-acetylmuramoyl-L-alanyl-D-glutamate--2,6-diaminopimelate ligase [bacterium]|nr:MAG: UDP-N-acetylmuramoyl-L-alanyl-D-glutamate--2,6-diaminopimelate ligase [bacterium]
MLKNVKNFIRPLIPKSLFKALQPVYHGLAATTAGWYYGNPSSELKVIGVTGTAGKSTTVMMLAHILNKTGHKTGYITTVGNFDGSTPIVNKQGLSMPAGSLIQKNLRDYLDKGCKFAVIEATSEGLAQNRHHGINFTGALFTNLSPAHIDSHGSFEKYRAAKGKLFASVNKSGVIGANTDDPNYQYFLNFSSSKKFGTSTREDKIAQTSVPVLRAENIIVSETGLGFEVEMNKFHLNLKGSFNISNALLAIGMAQFFGVSLAESSRALESFGTVPGRMETIPNNKQFTVIVDYAPEPKPLEESLRAAQLIEHNKLIHVFGATGGHRDVDKRFEFGKISAQFADTIIITNDDVYDSDPHEIAQNIQEGIKEAGPNKKVQKVMVELDRKAAIEKAVAVAKPGDLILITGKGSEQFLVLPGDKRISWDDRQIVKELLN